MPFYHETTLKRRCVGRLTHGADLLQEITELCGTQAVTLGMLQCIGAVSTACIGYYDQKRKVYEFTTIAEPLEIVSCMGNISLKDGAPMVHAHIILAKKDGHTLGGHCAPGTIVFAGEFCLDILEGPALHRHHDEVTGLPLWKME